MTQHNFKEINLGADVKNQSENQNHWSQETS